MKVYTSKGKQKFICEVAVLGRALTKTFIHIPFVVTPYGFMIPFGEWALRERCSRHPSSKRYHGGRVLLDAGLFPFTCKLEMLRY